MAPLLVFMFVLRSLSEASKVSQFTKTNVIYDTCFSTDGMQEGSTRDDTDCMIDCSDNVDCKRLMYCSSEPSCTSYIDGNDCITDRETVNCTCYKKDMDCNESGCDCPLGYYGDKCEHIFSDCVDAAEHGVQQEALVSIQPTSATEPFEILCSGGWATILYRTKRCQPENFNRTLIEYENGFGNVPRNSWIGFHHLLSMLSFPWSQFTLNIFIIIGDHSFCQAYYSYFTMASKEEGYFFRVGGYYGPDANLCGNSMTGVGLNLEYVPFSTYDQDYTTNNHCASQYGGGWWFADNENCSRSFLTGTMDGSGTDNFWLDDLGNVKFRRAQIRILRTIQTDE
ncbi:hypothetical protein SNE40_019274 [Patella caerulea]|uniref:Fibrinogen C-terminal domain-containing protein n=1 Tax=Patella caerulea TaxID=87958 RepID=A0AAN8J8Y4_PATCE